MRKKDTSKTRGVSKIKKIRQPYDLTVAHFDFPVDQMRILFRITEALQGEMVKNVQMDLFAAEDFQLILPVNKLLPANSENYSRVKIALEKLRENTIMIRGEDEEKGKYTRYTGVILRFDYFDNNKSVIIDLDRKILPKFLELKRGFTLFGLESVFNMESSYAMRLYLLIAHWADMPYKDFLVDELREILKCETKYKTTYDFKKNVIDPAKEIIKKNGLTEWYFSYEDIKEGSRVHKFRFYIHPKSTIGTLTQDKDSQNFTELITLLKRHFLLQDDQIKEIAVEIKAFADNEAILMKTIELYQILKNSIPDAIRDIPAWTLASLRAFINKPDTANSKTDD